MHAHLKDRLGSVLLLVFTASLWVQRDYVTPFGGIFPDLVMGILAVIATATLVLSFTSHAAIREDAGKAPEPTRWGDMAVVGAILLAWAALLQKLGFVLCGIVGFAAIAWYLAPRRKDPKVILGSLVVAALVTVVVVVVFQRLFEVPLPAGTLFES